MTAVPTARVWATNEELTAAIMISGITDPIDFLMNKPAWQVYSAAVQSIANNTYTALTFDTERLDDDPDANSGHSTVTNTSRFTATFPGSYWVSGTYTYSANATGFRAAVLAVNGTQQSDTRRIGPPASAGSSSHITVTGFVFLNAGDYVEVMGIQNSGAGLNTDTANSAFCSLSGKWDRLA